jgi:hypothetical protein
MRLRIGSVMTLAAVPFGVAVGLWMTALTEPTCNVYLDPRGGGTACAHSAGQALTQPRFSWWMSALIGAAAVAGLFALSRLVHTTPSSRVRWMAASVLRVLALPAGVGVGVGMAQFVSFCDLQVLRLVAAAHVCAWQTTFPLWSLILFGVASAAGVLLVAQAVQPTPRAAQARALPYHCQAERAALAPRGRGIGNERE